MIEYLKLIFYFNNFLVAFLHYNIGNTECGNGMFYKLPICFFITTYLRMIFKEYKWNTLNGFMEALNFLQIIISGVFIFGVTYDKLNQQCDQIAFYTRLWYCSIFLSMWLYI